MVFPGTLELSYIFPCFVNHLLLFSFLDLVSSLEIKNRICKCFLYVESSNFQKLLMLLINGVLIKNFLINLTRVAFVIFKSHLLIFI